MPTGIRQDSQTDGAPRRVSPKRGPPIRTHRLSTYCVSGAVLGAGGAARTEHTKSLSWWVTFTGRTLPLVTEKHRVWGTRVTGDQRAVLKGAAARGDLSPPPGRPPKISQQVSDLSGGQLGFPPGPQGLARGSRQSVWPSQTQATSSRAGPGWGCSPGRAQGSELPDLRALQEKLEIQISLGRLPDFQMLATL